MEQQIREPSATSQDILDLPETLVGEINNGRPITHPKLTAKALFAKGKSGGVLANHLGCMHPPKPVLTVSNTLELFEHAHQCSQPQYLGGFA